MFTASKKRLTACPSSKPSTGATGSAAFGPGSPILPFSSSFCNVISMIIECSYGQGMAKILGDLPQVHFVMSQTPASVECPGQFSSPPKSAPLQALDLSLDPWPQETLHSDHWPHSCHLAATAAIESALQNGAKTNDSTTLAL